MKRSLLLLVSCILVSGAFAQSRRPDSGMFLLHKFQQQIGKETYHISTNGNVVSYSADFKFTDRGSPVPLKAVLDIQRSNFEPLKLSIKGNVARGA
ncbi:MAG: hypothetical protein JSU01_00570, partial [Bacteroidetes bacterium]|nr:hypothetical protein [Bacteroidota bacterium]